MPPLGVASTAAKGTKIDGSRNEVWLCQGYTNGSEGIVLFVKPGMSIRALMVEALAALVGQCMDLPCPAPYIVTADPTHIGRPRGAKMVVFGSEQVGDRILTRSVRDIDTMLETLNKQHLVEKLWCFDDLVANSVRGPRDIVFHPEHGAAIIDHEGAMQEGVGPDETVTNWLASRVLERLPPDQLGLLLKRLRARAQSAHQMELTSVPASVMFDQRGVQLYTQLVEFLRRRLEHLDRLLSTRVFPEQAHLLAPPEQHVAGGTPDL